MLISQKPVFLKQGCVHMHKYAKMVSRIVQHIYLDIQSWRSYNTLKVKIVEKRQHQCWLLEECNFYSPW